MKRKSPRVLIVDDQVDFLLILRSLLNGIGFKNIQHRKNAYIALNEYMRFDVIFIDLAMPGLSGLDLIKTMRQDSKKRKIIVVTSDTDASTKQECLTNGADDFILKPINSNKIVASLKKINVLV